MTSRRMVLFVGFAGLILAVTRLAYPTVTEVSAANRYTADGTATSFPYSFKVLNATDLEVWVNTTVQILSTHYSVTGAGNASGGTVQFVTAPPAGAIVTILRKQPQQQVSVYQPNEAFPAKRIETDLDKLTMQVQQLQEQLNRALKVPVKESSIGPLQDVATRGGKFLAFDSNGVPIAAAGTSANLGPVSAFINTLLDDPDAATARATLGVTSVSTIDSDFRIQGSADNTKQLAFEVDGLTSNTTRTVTIPDKSGTLAYTSDLSAMFSTGDVKLTLKTTADPGWVLMNDGTIGSAASGATTRAHADTQPLYELIWANCVDQWCPVAGGRGASAAADFAANKPLALPKTLGRALAGYGTGVVTWNGDESGVNLTTNEFTVPSNTATWVTGMPVVFTLSSGTINGLVSGTTYYIIRSSATAVKLAASLANAQNGTAIDLTALSAPTWTLTHTFTARALGETLGEEAHAMSVTELLSHTHALTNVTSVVRNISGSWSFPGGTDKGASTISANTTGGNAAMNIMQPTVFFNVMIKL